MTENALATRLRGFDHRALNINQQAVGVRYAFQRDAAGAHNRNIGVKLRKCLHRLRPNQHAEPRINNPTGNQNLQPVCGCE